MKKRWKANQGALMALSSAGLQNICRANTSDSSRSSARLRAVNKHSGMDLSAPQAGVWKMLHHTWNIFMKAFFWRVQVPGTISFQGRRWQPWHNHLQWIPLYSSYACSEHMGNCSQGGTQKWARGKSQAGGCPHTPGFRAWLAPSDTTLVFENPKNQWVVTACSNPP